MGGSRGSGTLSTRSKPTPPTAEQLVQQCCGVLVVVVIVDQREPLAPQPDGRIELAIPAAHDVVQSVPWEVVGGGGMDLGFRTLKPAHVRPAHPVARRGFNVVG